MVGETGGNGMLAGSGRLGRDWLPACTGIPPVGDPTEFDRHVGAGEAEDELGHVRAEPAGQFVPATRHAGDAVADRRRQAAVSGQPGEYAVLWWEPGEPEALVRGVGRGQVRDGRPAPVGRRCVD